MDDIERRLRIVVPEIAGVMRGTCRCRGLRCGRCWDMKWSGGRCYMVIAEVEAYGGEAGRRGDGARGCTAITLAVLEEREEAEEGERGCKEGDKEGEEKGGRKGGDGNEVKGGYPAAHREFVERIKENQGKLEEAIAQMVVEALGMSGLSEGCSSSPSDNVQQENRRAEEESADGSLDITLDGSSDGEKKDEEQMQISKNDLAIFEESEIERSSIDIEKEEEEEEEEKVDGDMKFIFLKYKEQKQKEEIIHEVLEKWTRKL
ncbi:uncharacterized protein MONOS_14717 [Monocercomonoides exilis]|uniref:uncharacterized protein n=1 Tax=Monocercomonoides exilis TaxID=2049356 RepID=UPI00355ABD4C|nr:hypothetical protein MONOS_14717 [Monocercomonoides exilis]|eukprot:MONOS_14717.1-p1 / transcript=MONOS_14717.1 / gene=MONOS_14717 / organism=Monocercomonoides_exilis_PA203 / gene_product=unspecified product / transcript_product=unspecified product / location=Mono_scaffold01057:8878-9975(+) / protein_length=261 / sequence_SO=supercontig / SO=protein_coding / is_pseudo=false